MKVLVYILIWLPSLALIIAAILAQLYALAVLGRVVYLLLRRRWRQKDNPPWQR